MGVSFSSPLCHRVADNCDQLAQINNRILTSQAKIDKLRSASTKAARVFSSPKYPAPEAITDYHTIYQNVNPLLHRVRDTLALGLRGAGPGLVMCFLSL